MNQVLKISLPAVIGGITVTLLAILLGAPARILTGT